MDSIKLIGKLEDACIERYLDVINFKLDDNTSNDLYLCDVVVEHLAKGDLNDVYESDLIDGFSVEDKKYILDAVAKNSDICFSNNSHEYWLDTMKSMGIDDYKFALKKILDNYEFLVKICVRCGEGKLKLLSSLKDSKLNMSQSIVESIRDNYESDDEIISLLNSTLPPTTIKNNIIKAMDDDIIYSEDYALY